MGKIRVGGAEKADKVVPGTKGTITDPTNRNPVLPSQFVGSTYQDSLRTIYNLSDRLRVVGGDTGSDNGIFSPGSFFGLIPDKITLNDETKIPARNAQGTFAHETVHASQRKEAGPIERVLNDFSRIKDALGYPNARHLALETDATLKAEALQIFRRGGQHQSRDRLLLDTSRPRGNVNGRLVDLDKNLIRAELLRLGELDIHRSHPTTGLLRGIMGLDTLPTGFKRT